MAPADGDLIPALAPALVQQVLGLHRPRDRREFVGHAPGRQPLGGKRGKWLVRLRLIPIGHARIVVLEVVGVSVLDGPPQRAAEADRVMDEPGQQAYVG